MYAARDITQDRIRNQHFSPEIHSTSEFTAK
jgi:hypothetical protein